MGAAVMGKKAMELESRFFQGLIELQYGLDVEEKLKKIAPEITWAKGWPDDQEAFWNAESYMWGRKIEKEIRAAVAWELKFIAGGKNLDLGCGAYSYLPSVGFDLSPLMLKLNEQCYEKMQGDVEKKLPFPNTKFDSVTAVFLLNYVKNHRQLLAEVHRMLKPQGHFVMVLSAKGINAWQKRKEANALSPEEWTKMLKENNFSVEHYERKEVLFWKAKKNH